MTTEERLGRLEDPGSIRHVKAPYCACVDVGWKTELPDRKDQLINEVFSEDMVWEVLTAAGPSDRLEGRQEIRDRFDAAIAPFPFGIHFVMTPKLEVDG